MKKLAIVFAALVVTGCAHEAPLRFHHTPMTVEERIEFNRSPLHELACYECKWGRSLEEQSAWEAACYKATLSYDCRGL